MTLDPVRLVVYCIVALVLAGGGAAAAWAWQANSYEARIANLKAGFQTDLATIARVAAQQAGKALEKQQAAQAQLAALDQKATEDRTRALLENEKLSRQYLSARSENDRLRGDVADGARRLRIAGSCVASGSDVPQASGAASLGDATTVELTGEAGQAVFDIREGIIRDQAALKTLQEYATICHVDQPSTVR